MSFKNNFGENVKAKNDGVWYEFSDGIEFKIASISSKDVLKTVKEIMKEHQKHNLMDIVENKETIKSLIKVLVKDWKGIDDDDNQKIEFSEKNVNEYLLQQEDGEFVFDKVLSWIITKSQSVNEYTLKYSEEKLKN